MTGAGRRPLATPRYPAAAVLRALAEEARIVKTLAEGVKAGGRLGPDEHQRLAVAVSRIANALHFTESLPLDDGEPIVGRDAW